MFTQKVVYCCFCLVLLLQQSCVMYKNTEQKKTNTFFNNKKNKTNVLLKKYINKPIDFLYKDLGEPMEKKTTINGKKEIVNIKFVYKYVYNFKQKKYDCHINFFVDKNSQKITHFTKSSKKCDYIVFDI